jgi:hypothetical protein
VALRAGIRQASRSVVLLSGPPFGTKTKAAAKFFSLPLRVNLAVGLRCWGRCSRRLDRRARRRRPGRCGSRRNVCPRVWRGDRGMMRVMTTALPTIMISGWRRFWFCAWRSAVMTMAVFVAVVACHSVKRKGENPDPQSGAQFKSSSLLAASSPWKSIRTTPRQGLTPHSLE